MICGRLSYLSATLAFLAATIVAFAGQKSYHISLNAEGQSLSAPLVTHSLLGRGLSFVFSVPSNTQLYCEVRAIDSDPSQIAALPQGENNLCAKASATTPVQIPAAQGALYYYVVRKVASEDVKKQNDDQKKKLDDLRKELEALKSHSSGSESLKELERVVAATGQEIKDTSDAVKAYAGMSTPAAADGVTKLVERLKTLQDRLRTEKQKVSAKQEYEATKKQVEAQQKVVDALKADKWEGLRAGIVPIGDDKRPVYYRFVQSSNLETPFRLERLGEFPIFTVKNDLYLVIINHRQSEKPSDFQLSYGTEQGAVIDIAPLRPTIDQPTPIKISRARPVITENKQEVDVDFDNAYVDRVLPFANKLPGETKLTVTVSSYAQIVTTNKEETGADGTTTTVIKETKTVKLLDGEKWPQIHSLFYFNLSTGVVATWLRDPAFSRVLAEAAVPANGNAAAVSAKYKTAEDRGSARAMPVLAFSAYLRGMDVQVPWSRWNLIPEPTVAFSLTSPADDFFFGASSELRRNVQVIYGYHLGKVTHLGPQGVDDPTSSNAPITIKRFQGNVFFGLTFNVNFIKNLFGL